MQVGKEILLMTIQNHEEATVTRKRKWYARVAKTMHNNTKSGICPLHWHLICNPFKNSNKMEEGEKLNT